jgi:hypothetical protein
MTEGFEAKHVIFLGGFMHEGIRSSLAARGISFSSLKLYGVGPRRWRNLTNNIRLMREEGSLAGVVLYLPTPVVLQGAQGTYWESWDEMVTEVSKTNAIAFMFADKLLVNFDRAIWKPENPYRCRNLKHD